jgi:hypothetical protein
MNNTEQTSSVGDRRQPCRSQIGERMFRQRVYMPADVWAQLDALMRLHGDDSVNKTLARLVRDAHSRRMKADDDSTDNQNTH